MTARRFTLAKIGRLDVLCDAGREVVVPSAVAREVLAGPVESRVRPSPSTR
jgi:hypothetical protein